MRRRKVSLHIAETVTDGLDGKVGEDAVQEGNACRNNDYGHKCTG